MRKKGMISGGVSQGKRILRGVTTGCRSEYELGSMGSPSSFRLAAVEVHSRVGLLHGAQRSLMSPSSSIPRSGVMLC